MSIAELYAVWRETRDAYNALGAKAFGLEGGPIFDRHTAAEDAIAAATPTSMQEMAFKIIVADDCGDMSMNIGQRLLVKEAYRIAGVEGWREEDEAKLVEWQQDAKVACEAYRHSRALEG